VENAVNVEAFFIRSQDIDQILQTVRERLESSDDPPGLQPKWGLESSYDVLLAGNRKRKIAISEPRNGWIAGIESKEVVDFALLKSIADRTRSDVVVFQISDVTGEAFAAIYREGQPPKMFENDPEQAPVTFAMEVLGEIGIPFDVVSFRELTSEKTWGWHILRREAQS